MVNHTLSVLGKVVEGLPIGTNLALLHFLWMLVSGKLLPNRGALFPALQAIGLSDAATRRAWGAFRYGVWHIAGLVMQWKTYVTALPDWQPHRYEGYAPITVDVTAFWRPTLKNCPSQQYHPAAQRALPAVIIGLVGEVGEINGQRLAVPRAIERVHPQDPREARLWENLLRHVQKTLATDEIVVVDAGVKIQALQKAGVTRYVVRLPINFTARRNYLPVHTRGRKPTYGACVRPLARQYKGKPPLTATEPDERATWRVDERVIQVLIWRNLVLPTTKPDASNPTFDVYVFDDPAFKKSWVLATPVALTFESVHALYTDRWPVEQLPLSAKHMVGAHRQFVHHPESVQRLPELAVFAGSLLSFLAATLPAAPPGFWDRRPARTPGRLRRLLIGLPFPKDAPLPRQLREKQSATAHLSKGHAARLPRAA
jgi:hypothetical protein